MQKQSNNTKKKKNIESRKNINKLSVHKPKRK